MSKVYTLVVHLDQYAGNVDEVVCNALIGHGDDRSGAGEGQRLFNEAGLGKLVYDAFEMRFSEYGTTSYEVHSGDSNSLELFPDSYAIDELPKFVKAWRAAYPDGITYKTYDDREHTVKIKGFSLITETVEKTMEAL